MAKKIKSPSYATYSAKGSFKANALRKIAKHLKKHPNDSQAATALKNVPAAPTRNSPNNKNGWVTESVRGFMSHLPFLTPLQGKTYATHVAATKSNLKAYALIRKFVKNNPFHPTLVLNKKTNDYEWKHVSKLSNFHPAVV